MNNIDPDSASVLFRLLRPEELAAVCSVNRRFRAERKLATASMVARLNELSGPLTAEERGLLYQDLGKRIRYETDMDRIRSRVLFLNNSYFPHCILPNVKDGVALRKRFAWPSLSTNEAHAAFLSYKIKEFRAVLNSFQENPPVGARDRGLQIKRLDRINKQLEFLKIRPCLPLRVEGVFAIGIIGGFVGMLAAAIVACILAEGVVAPSAAFCAMILLLEFGLAVLVPLCVNLAYATYCAVIEYRERCYQGTNEEIAALQQNIQTRQAFLRQPLEIGSVEINGEDASIWI